MRGATLFSGGGGAEALLRTHINFVHAVEYDAQIAAVYAANIGPHVQIARVEDVDYTTWGALDYLHASPVCKEYSQAKTNGAEGDGDLSSAAAVARCLEATQPRVFTLENVGAYQHGQAFRLIVQWLNHNGYMWHAEVLNAADFGVPQTRRRLILRAVRDALLPGLPPPVKWVGWYEAIADLIPTLPESQFAPWQKERLPAEIQTMLVAQGKYGDKLVLSEYDDPAFTITANSNQTGLRAFLMTKSADKYGDGLRLDVEPSHTIAASAHGTRAFLIPIGTESQPRYADEPAHTTTSAHYKNMPKSWLTSGRVVKMTPHALARFQSFPDWYELPAKASLACTIIGNAAPSLLMQQIVEPLL